MITGFLFSYLWLITRNNCSFNRSVGFSIPRSSRTRISAFFISSQSDASSSFVLLSNVFFTLAATSPTETNIVVTKWRSISSFAIAVAVCVFPLHTLPQRYKPRQLFEISSRLSTYFEHISKRAWFPLTSESLFSLKRSETLDFFNILSIFSFFRILNHSWYSEDFKKSCSSLFQFSQWSQNHSTERQTASTRLVLGCQR